VNTSQANSTRAHSSVWDLLWDLLYVLLGTVCSVVAFWLILRNASGEALQVMLEFWIVLWALVFVTVLVSGLFSTQPEVAWEEYLKLNTAFIVAAILGFAVFLFVPHQLMVGIMLLGASLPYVPKDTLGKFLEETLDIAVFAGLYAVVSAPILGIFWFIEGQPWREYLIFGAIYAALKSPIVGEWKRGVKRMYVLIVLSAITSILLSVYEPQLYPFLAWLPGSWQSIGLFTYLAMWSIVIELLMTWHTDKVKPWWYRSFGPWVRDWLDDVMYPWKSSAFDAILADTTLTLDEVLENTYRHIHYVMFVTVMALFPAVMSFVYLLRLGPYPYVIAVVPFGIFYLSAMIVAFLTKSLGE
jgi:hypothetical protein